MKKRTSWVGLLLILTFAGAGLGLALAQNSPGGAFLTNYNYILSGQWTWRTVSPWIIEGATDDEFETTITFDEPTSDVTLTFPNGGGSSAAFLLSTLTTNDVGVANSVWGISGGFVFEGSTADASEITVLAADAAADVTYTFRSDSADTYHPLAMPDGDVTGGFWQIPEYGAADADLTMTDNTLYVYRVYLPHYLTIANVYGRTTQGANVAGTDDILGVAIYEDADAGAQLTEAVSADITATANVTFNVTDVTLGPGFYRVAVCSGDGDGAAFVGDTVDDEFIDVANLGAVTIGTGANSCVAGNPPATTGALSTADVNVPVLKAGA